MIRPGGPCLHCMAILDPALVREEFLTDDERSIEVARGYLRGLQEPAPAVLLHHLQALSVGRPSPPLLQRRTAGGVERPGMSLSWLVPVHAGSSQVGPPV